MESEIARLAAYWRLIFYSIQSELHIGRPFTSNGNFSLFSLGIPPQIFCSFLDQSSIGQLWTFGYLPNPTKSDKKYYFKCKC